MSAVFSSCELFRYRLERDLSAYDPIFCNAGPTVAICGVNPSTADAVLDDATIRRDIGFGRRLGWRGLIKANLFAFRSTDVRGLASAADPVGPENDRHLSEIVRDADIVIGAWGPLAKLPLRLRTRWEAFVTIATSAGKPIMCFGTAQDGQPRHTLMLAYETKLEPWSAPCDGVGRAARIQRECGR